MIVWLNLAALALSLGSFAVGRQPIGAVMAGIGCGMAIVLLAFDERAKARQRR
jgi:1,4-dihydroxy-2-naphthoate octaprenyltransferase